MLAHLLVHAHALALTPIDGGALLADAGGAARPSSALAHLLATVTRAATESQMGRFALVGDLLAGGILLIACGTYGLRRSR